MIKDGLHDVPAGKVAMVVTHLEMLAPAPTSGKAEPHDITFRRVEADLAWYRDMFDRVGTDWLWYGRRRLEDCALASILNDPDVALYTLQKDGRDEALLELDFRTNGQCELAYFGLTKALIGTGAGRYLMDQAIRLAWAAPIKRFHVHTCTLDSAQALDFYQRSGFTPYKRQVEVDNDPRLSGHLPTNAAPHVPLIR
ncbi:GNAT family N-acetyltransferase [Sulfitobacter sp. F26204]|uniref:GNAT family N-acetyltransferase n=1 Tax=Sulfitobacter sp. F26204 TaxID=2996014 RepID=UPI00225E4DB3|nr:GNAT family N-acetyltransferase [Sulfitobacter sp. F26204]MCX7558485.1 GNAT family N-acetyltransferase [Sulfitobacter sp. F26204]